MMPQKTHFLLNAQWKSAVLITVVSCPSHMRTAADLPVQQIYLCVVGVIKACSISVNLYQLCHKQITEESKVCFPAVQGSELTVFPPQDP